MQANKIFLPIVLVMTLSAGAVDAKPFGSERGAHIIDRFEHLLDDLDLNEEQEHQAGEILKTLKENGLKREHLQSMRLLMTLSPDDADYDFKVSQQADIAAEQVKNKIIQMAHAKQAIYQILDSEQQRKMSEIIDKRLRKMEKRLRVNHDKN